MNHKLAHFEDDIKSPLIKVSDDSLEFKVVWLPDKEQGGPETYHYFGEAISQAIASGDLPAPEYALPTTHLSTTQIEMYLKCPRQYELRYVEGRKTPAVAPMVLGSVFHTVLERAYRLLKEGQYPELDFVKDTYLDQIKSSIEKEEIEFEEGSPKETLIQTGESLLDLWYKTKLTEVKPLEIEKAFIMFTGGVPLVGIIDLIDGSGGAPCVVDNKVASRKPPQADVDGSLQLTMYSAATRVGQQRLDVFAKTKTPTIHTINTVRKQHDIKWFSVLVRKIVESIVSGSFPPCNPTSWACSKKWCKFWDICRGSL